MEQKFFPYLCDPVDKGSLKLEVFESNGDNVLQGVLINQETQNSFPIINGVAVMLPSAFPTSYLEKYATELEKVKQTYSNIEFLSSTSKTWSFSLEWEAFANDNMDITWGLDKETRFQHFLLETQSDEKNIVNNLILDAGCGNGLLTEYFADKGMISFGIDYSDSVFSAEHCRKNKNVCFIKGNLECLPFKSEVFDILVSNGVIHHTRSTEKTFYSIAETVKNNGKLYLNLYSRKGSSFWRFKRRMFDIARFIVCRLPNTLQKGIVEIFTWGLSFVHPEMDKKTLRLNMFDSLTPRWRHYHTPEEICYWYNKAGYGPLVLTHWKNKYGFGVYALKTRMDVVPYII